MPVRVMLHATPAVEYLAVRDGRFTLTTAAADLQIAIELGGGSPTVYRLEGNALLGPWHWGIGAAAADGPIFPNQGALGIVSASRKVVVPPIPVGCPFPDISGHVTEPVGAMALGF